MKNYKQKLTEIKCQKNEKLCEELADNELLLRVEILSKCILCHNLTNPRPLCS